MAKGKKSIFKSIVMIVLIIMLIAAIGGVASYLVGLIEEGTGDDVDGNEVFYVKIAGKKITSSAYGYKCGTVGDNTFAIDIVSDSYDIATDFSYSVKADSGLCFTYIADDSLFQFNSSEDVSDFFVIETTDSGIVVCSKGSSLTNMLSAIYPEAEISYDDSTFDYDTTMFWLTISLKENTQEFVKLGFSLRRYDDVLSLDVEEIIF